MSIVVLRVPPHTHTHTIYLNFRSRIITGKPILIEFQLLHPPNLSKGDTFHVLFGLALLDMLVFFLNGVKVRSLPKYKHILILFSAPRLPPQPPPLATAAAAAVNHLTLEVVGSSLPAG